MLQNMFIFNDFSIVFNKLASILQRHLRIFITDYQSFILNPAYAINSR
jgi:hypothetical protein